MHRASHWAPMVDNTPTASRTGVLPMRSASHTHLLDKIILLALRSLTRALAE